MVRIRKLARRIFPFMITVIITLYGLSVYILLSEEDKHGHLALSDNLISKTSAALKLINILTCHIL